MVGLASVAPGEVQRHNEGQGFVLGAVVPLEAGLDPGGLAGSEAVSAVEDLAVVSDDGLEQAIGLHVLGEGDEVVAGDEREQVCEGVSLTGDEPHGTTKLEGRSLNCRTLNPPPSRGS